MNKLYNTLNSQLVILNIEGYQSECNIYHWEEEQIDEKECSFCHGKGVCETYWQNDLPAGYKDCPECGGTGVIEKIKIVPVKEVEISNNILI